MPRNNKTKARRRKLKQKDKKTRHEQQAAPYIPTSTYIETDWAPINAWMDEISHQFKKILNENKKEQWWHGVGSGTVLKMQAQEEREIQRALQAKEARIAEDLNQEL